MDSNRRLGTTCQLVALHQRRLPTPPAAQHSENPETPRPAHVDNVDGRQLSKVHPHLVHPVPITLVPLSPNIQALAALSEISLIDISTSSQDDGDHSCGGSHTLDNNDPTCGCQGMDRAPVVIYAYCFSHDHIALNRLR